MADITTITIARKAGIHSKFRAKELGISVKEYTENALSYFYSRGINPVGHCPSVEFETNELIKKVGDRIISFIRQQEKTILKDQSEVLEISLKEMIKSNYLINAIIMILIENFYSSDIKRKEVEAELREYVNENLKIFEENNKRA